MKILINLFAAILMMMLMMSELGESQEMLRARKNFMTDEKTQSLSKDESKLKKFRRCGKIPRKSRKHGRPRGAFEGYGFFVPHSDSQFFEELVREGKSADQRGGEIFEPKIKNSTSILSIIKKFLKNFRLRGSSTTQKYHETSLPDEAEWEHFESTTIDNRPIELILPVSGPFLNLTTTKIPDDVVHEVDHTFYESSSEENREKNLENSSESSGSILFGGRHATFDLEIKAIPILNKQRIVISGNNQN